MAGTSLEPGLIPFSAPRVLGGRYVVGGQIGAGAHGAVYECIDRRKPQDPLAVKFPLRSQDVALLRQERRTLTLLRDFCVDQVPEVVTYVDGGLVMRKVDGFSLDYFVRRKADKRPLLPPRARYVLGVAQTLEAVTGIDILHRDINPHNIRVNSQGTYLMDWGLASTIEESAQAGWCGTWDYMAPELLGATSAPSPASEVYSLTATFYALLTSVPPRGVSSSKVPEIERAKSLLKAKISAPQELNPLIPDRVSRLLMSGLATNPCARPDPVELREELEGCVEQLERSVSRR